MSSLVQNIKQNTQAIKTGGVLALQKGISELANVSKGQYVANQSAIKQQIKQFTQAALQNIKSNQQQIGTSTKVKGLIRKLADVLPAQNLRQVGGQLSRIDRSVDNAIKNNVQQQIKQNKTAALQNQIFQAAVQSDGSGLSINPSFKGQVSSPLQNMQPIQRQIYQYRGLLSTANNISVVTEQNVPRSVQFLQRYAQTQNKIPIGKVTGSQGVAFVGVQKVKTPDGRQLLFKYQQNQVRQTLVPNIPMQLRYHSNRTINSWNSFVEQQSKLVKFLNKVSSQKNREQYTHQMFKKLNLQTFSAQVLATLVFYYIYLPMQKFIKTNLQTFNYSLESFLESYSIGIKSNPLYLPTETAKKVVQILLLKNKEFLLDIKTNNIMVTPVAVLTRILLHLSFVTSKIGESQRKKLAMYVQQKQGQARLFFVNSGISVQTQSGLLANPDWTSVKRRSFFFPGNTQNNQYNVMCKSIIDKSSEKKQFLWDLTWQSSSIPAFDYVFEDKFYFN